MTEHLRADRFEIHPSRRVVLVDGRELDIGSRAFDLLVVLAENRDRVLSKRELMHRVWPGLVVEENTLQAQISLLRKRLGAESIATVAGRGYRFVVPVAAVSSDAAPHAPDKPVAPIGLPAFGGRFIGRARETAECLSLIASSDVLTLTGIGGSGKTRLAVEIARAQAERSPVCFVDLSVVSGPGQIWTTIAQALGVRERADTPPNQAVRQVLQRFEGTLVLDNCEHVSTEAAAVVTTLASASRRLRILATSRHPLAVQGEQIYLVQPLSMPATPGLPAAAASEAIQLFVDRTRLIDPGFVLDDMNVASVAEVVRRLDGIPLAIELAAARMKLLTANQLKARLDERFRLLIGGGGTLARQQTLRASMQWSYELLSPPAQQMLRGLAVFAGGWMLESATAVCASGGDELETLELLTNLYDKSLLVVSGTEFGERRYGMLQTVRQYAQETLLDPAEQPSMQSRHRKHFLTWVDELIPSSQAPLGAAVVGRLRHEQANLRAALDYCGIGEGGASDALRLAGSLWPYWLATSQLEEGHDFTARALGIAAGSGSAGVAAEHAKALLGFGNIEFYRGRYHEALAAAEACLRLARLTGDPVVLGFAYKLRAGGHHALGETQLAISDYQATLDIAVAGGELVLQASALNNLAEVYRGLGELEVAEQTYLRAVAAGRLSGAADKLAILLCNLCRLYAMSGRLQLARESLREAHEVAVRQSLRRIGDDAIDIAAGLASMAGDHCSAARFHGASLSRMDESGSQREPVDEAFLSPLLESSRLSLGSEGFDAACREGANLGYDEAMDELRRLLQPDFGTEPTGRTPQATAGEQGREAIELRFQ